MTTRRPAAKTSVDYSATLPMRQPVSVIGETVRRLRIAIMTGRLAPGQKLVEADLCREFAVSRASIRETLRLLQAEQLIETAPHRGASVVRLGRKDVEDIHDIWSLLTGEAVLRFARQAVAADIDALNAAIARLRDAAGRRDVLGQLSAVNAFFGHILDRCGNQALIGTVSALVSRVNFLRAQALDRADLGSRMAGELRAIAAAIAGGEPEAARLATQRHITAACEAAKRATLAPPRRLPSVRTLDAETDAAPGPAA